MRSIRAFSVPGDSLAIWYFGQNGFILKSSSGLLIGIDLYLTDSCAKLYAHLPYRLDRQLPVFVEPEDLDIDLFCTTHSHDDHADPETIRRFTRKNKARFVGPWESIEKYRSWGVDAEACILLHPNQAIPIDNTAELVGTFALPTDATDLNHMGLLFRYANGITFYNTGDTGFCGSLDSLLPQKVDICCICINGGFNNLGPMQAASIVKAIAPAVAVPCHYDMMINNVGDPDMFRTSLEVLGSNIPVRVLEYYEPWVFR